MMKKLECNNYSESKMVQDKKSTITLFEKVKAMNIEEMADFLAPLFNECYSCELCTDERQRSNIIKILNEEAN